MNNALDWGEITSRDTSVRREHADVNASAPTCAAETRRAPHSVGQTGLDLHFLAELAAKAAAVEGKITLAHLVERLKLPIPVLNEVTGFMIRERVLEVTHRGAADFDVQYQLTEEGRVRAIGYLAKCTYIGPAPVSLEAYTRVIASQSVNLVRISRSFALAALADIKLSDAMIDDVGGAMNSGRPILLYGPAGGGKTYIAECLAKLLPGHIDVPYALLIDRSIVQIFDPLIHQPVEAEEHGLINALPDRRWQRCSRPVVMAGGELTLDMLELRYDAGTGFYQAPGHMKANNGLYIVDDLGRQRVAPQDLLNRWIIPLGRGSETLTLQNGARFSLPFDVRLAFSSNLTPEQLGDEAFLRRLGCKLFVGPLDQHEYRELYDSQCAQLGVQSDDGAFDYLLQHLHLPGRRPLLACYPRDLLGLVVAHASYREEAPVATPETLRRAWNNYFASSGEHDSIASKPVHANEVVRRLATA